MKKILRRTLKFTGITLGVLLLLIILIPLLFGSQIKEAVKGYINDEINAEVYFEDIGISVFNNFPNITVTLDKFGVVNKEPFAGDTLADVEHFGVVVDLFSIFGDKYVVHKVTLDQPTIHAQVNREGIANWDIMKPSEEEEPEEEEVVEEEETEEGGGLALDLTAYSLTGANVIYDDKPGAIYAEIVNLNHSGSGNFAGDLFDFDTETTADEITLRMDGDSYANKLALDADVTISIDNANSVYTLKNNRIGLNALNLHFDGFVAMTGDDINMDLTFETNDNKFSHILSMVPGMYTEDFGDLDTDGTFALDGKVAGKYNENSLPAFNVHLGVENGHFAYPDLPQDVKDINFDVKVDCPDGDLNKLGINMPSFHALFGANPIDARCVLSGLMTENYNIDATAKASLDLEEILKIFPMEGYDLKGSFVLDGTAKGVYNEKTGALPGIDAKMELKDGYFKTPDFPSAISNMSMIADAKVQATDLSKGTLNVKQFHGEIDGDPIDATLAVNDFDAINYDLHAHGKLSLDKLNKILELEDTQMGGLMTIDLDTKGNLAAVEEERYNELPTSGSMKLTNFSYSSPDLPQGVAITSGGVDFDPRKMTIQNIVGKLGSSPFAVNGSFDNYLGYALLPDQELTGSMEFRSSRFNVNEWMVEEGEEAPEAEAAEAPTEEVEMVAFEVPKGIDFVFDTRIDRVIYDNLNLDNMTGKVIMRDEKIQFENLKFNTLGGSMRVNGSYATPDPASPEVHLSWNLDNLDIGQSYKMVEMVKDIAPIAKFMEGRLNSTLKLDGYLTSDMMPDLASITSVGDMKIFNSTLKGFKGTEMIADKIKLNKLKELDIKDTKVLYEIHDGKVWVEPFDIPMGSGKMTVDGAHGLDQQMAYNLKLDLPAGAAGATAMKAVGDLIKTDLGSDFKVNVGLGGTVDKPKITYIKNEKGEGATDMVEEKIDEVKEEVKEKVEEKVEEVKEKVEEKIDEGKAKAKAEADKILKEAEAQAAKIRAEARKQAQKVRDEANKQADQIEASAKNPIQKAAKKKLADKTRKTGEQSAKKIEDEADGKAQKIIDDARKRSDALLK